MNQPLPHRDPAAAKTHPLPNASKTAREVMTTRLYCIEPDTVLPEICEMLDANGISGLPVVDESKKLVGIVSRTDVLRKLLGTVRQGSKYQPLRTLLDLASSREEWDHPTNQCLASDMMTTELVTARPEHSINQLAESMATDRVHRVVVVNEEAHPIGIITSLDLLDHFPGTSTNT